MSEFLQFLSEFTILFLTAVFLENTVLVRGFGLSRAMAIAIRPRSIFIYGSLLTLISILGGVACYGVKQLFSGLPGAYLPLVYLTAHTAVYLVIYAILVHTGEETRESARHYLPVASFNCAVMGSIFLALYNGYALWQFIALGLGNGIGFILATLLLLNAERVLNRTEAPRSFAGFPVMLIYVGILGLAFYSLVGHRLPF